MVLGTQTDYTEGGLARESLRHPSVVEESLTRLSGGRVCRDDSFLPDVLRSVSPLIPDPTSRRPDVSRLSYPPVTAEPYNSGIPKSSRTQKDSPETLSRLQTLPSAEVGHSSPERRTTSPSKV